MARSARVCMEEGSLVERIKIYGVLAQLASLMQDVRLARILGVKIEMEVDQKCKKDQLGIEIYKEEEHRLGSD
ncbi:hypothetical protein KI387_004128, partial [Taxus chinensis]